LSDRVIKLTLSYDGTDFKGWQRLGDSGRTVQACLEKALERVLGQQAECDGAGRTDAGVHALAQVASFHTSSKRPAESILRDLNAILPQDIACLGCEDADPRFHARYRALGKAYRYRIHNAPVPDPFLRRYSLHVGDPLDIQAMRAAAQVFVGRHNFQSFTNLKEKGKSFERTISSAEVEKKDGFIDMTFQGDGFLHNQVRIMSGGVIACGLGRLEPAELKRVLEARDRGMAPGAAGAFGLCLIAVKY
jgi:tRNA pseudouridine38-40 synthase